MLLSSITFGADKQNLKIPEFLSSPILGCYIVSIELDSDAMQLDQTK